MKLKRKAEKTMLMVLAVLLVMPAAATAAAAQALIPGGGAVGIQMNTDGVLIIGTTQSESEGAQPSPAAEAGLQPGDLIVRFGDHDIKTAADMVEPLREMCGEPVTLTVRREGKQIVYTVLPSCDEKGVWRLGVLLRDGVAGIGTITYINPENGSYGALGHGVCDTQTGVLLPVGDGQIMKAEIENVIPGKNGAPGELCGEFDVQAPVGSICGNTENGIFGSLSQQVSGNALEAAESDEIETGAVTIRSNVSGTEVCEYDAEITRVYRAPTGETRMMLSITDEKLLDVTGGIVQGMSGSPIIQNGKLIGAVTHVFISDPCKGYGVSIQDMLTAAETVQSAA